MTTLVDIEAANRWAEATLKLIKLTQEGKMRWSREPDRHATFRYSSGEQYSAYFQGRNYVLSFELPINTLQRYGTGAVSLEVFDGLSRLMSFPDLPPLGGLAVAVQAQVSHTDEEILRTIAEAN